MAARRQMALRGIVRVVLAEGIGLVTIIALLVLGLRHDAGIGAVVALLYGLSRFHGLTGGLSNQVRILSDRWTTVACLRDFLTLPVERHPAARAVSRPFRDGVRFHDVSFTYPGAARPALRGVNLLLRPGEHVALVGEIGAGKTTLVRLLLGLYRPTSGRITVDGIDLTDLDPTAWRREATAVFQDFVRYQTSVVENIAYGDVGVLGDMQTASMAANAGEPRRSGEARAGASHRPSRDSQDSAGRDGPVDPRVVRAATSSGAADFVSALPHGYATLLGSVFEGAVDLSAGQWQRLALARAYLRDAQIVVLDEPTAALDPRGEVAVYRRFREAAAGRCALFISHRLGSARLAERIVVLQEGRVVEEGTHAALLTAGGEYARLYRLQATWYQDHAAEGAQQ